MRRGLALLCASTLWLAGCDGYVSRSEHQARLAMADYTGWIEAKAESRDRKIREIGVVKVGALHQGGEATIPLDVTGVHDAAILGTCDIGCSDLDLRLVTDDGRLIDLDEDEDHSPRVDVEAGKPNKLLLKVRMARCTSGSCTFAVSQFQYDDPTPGSGTCFAVSPDGLLVTSHHVVDAASKITVVFPDGRKGEATVLRESIDNDLALLRTRVATPEWLPFAGADDISLGMPAFTVGFPTPQMLGSEAKFTEGHVSSLSGFKEEPTLLQVSIPIQPGNSGGPVVSYSGKVIGVIESAVDKDRSGGRMQLTNFARNAQVASLILPSQTNLPTVSAPRSREQLLGKVMKSVCKVEIE